MKIGILTFHSQLNYGGVLQCWALQQALIRLGHDVVVIDRWWDKANYQLWRGVDKWGWRDWARLIKHALVATGELSILLRQWRTIHWMRREWKLTPYHFSEWREVRDAGLDAICVGSDQVWSYTKGFNTRPYLLDGAPKVPAIAYAVSMGMPQLPDDASKKLFSEGARRFSTISVRERTGQEILASVGVATAHVADPTLMIGREFWHEMFPRRERRRLVAYIISESIAPQLPILKAFAKREHCKVDVLLDVVNNPIYYAGPLHSWRNAVKWVLRLLDNWFSPVRIHSAAGPIEFVKYFSRAKWVVSDSFHALMFSTVYGKNVRLLRPTIPFRVRMFSRISDFVQDFVEGQAVSESMDEALKSFSQGESITFREGLIAAFVKKSQDWLSNAAKGLV